MLKIYKYPLGIVDEQEIRIPGLFKILSVHKQRNQLCLWAIVDDDREIKSYFIEVIGTGNPFPYFCEREFIGTVVMDPFVWHVFHRK